MVSEFRLAHVLALFYLFSESKIKFFLIFFELLLYWQFLVAIPRRLVGFSLTVLMFHFQKIPNFLLKIWNVFLSFGEFRSVTNFEANESSWQLSWDSKAKQFWSLVVAFAFLKTFSLIYPAAPSYNLSLVHHFILFQSQKNVLFTSWIEATNLFHFDSPYLSSSSMGHFQK